MNGQAGQKRKVFFPNLDGLRFICFLMVFFFHSYKTVFDPLRTTTDKTGQQVYSIIRFLFQHGELGVNFFFVLSGFLITFLLIAEQDFTGRIHLGNFYIRRILRIWPLFYLCVFIGFVVWPLLKHAAGGINEETSTTWTYLLFANNFDYIRQQSISATLFPDALILIVLWSVAVEEQFYLVWPLLFKLIRRRFYPVLFSSILILSLIFRLIHNTDSLNDHAIRQFHTLAVIGDMALGGLFAWLCSGDTAFLRFIKSLKWWQTAFVYTGALIVYFFRTELFSDTGLYSIERLVIGLFFIFIILIQNFAEKPLFKLSSFKTISKWGVYTYGLYCLHFLVISLMNNAAPRLGISLNSWPLGLLVTAAALGASMVAAYISYHLFEKHFLRLKDRFAFISRH